MLHPTRMARGMANYSTPYDLTFKPTCLAGILAIADSHILSLSEKHTLVPLCFIAADSLCSSSIICGCISLREKSFLRQGIAT